MAFYDDETISAATGVVKTLDRTKIDNEGNSRAAMAVIQNSAVANTGVRLRFNDDPTSSIGYLLNPGDIVQVDGYKNLINLKILLVGSSSPASLFVQYST